MSTITIAILLVSGITMTSLIFSYMSNQEIKKRMHKLLVTFSELGSQYNLSFTSQELLKKQVIGLDGLNRKLLVLREDSGKYDWNIIDLHEVKNCAVKKKYNRINAGDLKTKRLEDYMDTIQLEFTFKHGGDPVSIDFYTNNINSVFEIGELEEKAKGWEMMLSKMLTTESQQGVAISS